MEKDDACGSEFGSSSSENVMTISVPLAVPETKVGTVLSSLKGGVIRTRGRGGGKVVIGRVGDVLVRRRMPGLSCRSRLAMSPPVGCDVIAARQAEVTGVTVGVAVVPAMVKSVARSRS